MNSFQGLVADIGGTNTRLALVENGRVCENTISRVRNTDFATAEDAIVSYLSSAGNPKCPSAVIAVAAPIEGPTVRMTNHSWILDSKRINTAMSGAEVQFLNDFEALGYSLDSLDLSRLRPVYQPDTPGPGGQTKLVVGSGTGFNAAALLTGRKAKLVGTGECGHSTLPVVNEREMRLWTYLARGRGRASVERALSGQGLREMYEWCCMEAAQAPKDYLPADIARLANSKEDPVCDAVARQWATFLGRVIGDLALIFMALDGIVLTGGVTRNLAKYLSEPEFLSAFKAKGRQTGLVSGIPILLLEDDFAALSGCAAKLSN